VEFFQPHTTRWLDHHLQLNILWLLAEVAEVLEIPMYPVVQVAAGVLVVYCKQQVFLLRLVLL
jgi:hypothetical protein